MLTPINFMAIGIGAAAGAICRWALGLWLNQPGWHLPWGTLAANLIGGYFVGLLLGGLSMYPEAPIWLKLMLITGFLGGLTTFSTFSGEAVGLLERGAYLSAFGYIGFSLVGSLALTCLGFATASLISTLSQAGSP
ncbi:fluoride efflux transporter CrcB [Pollutimonas nitritireducens]|uniref:Fluoride-specific ion channel FluC n=1 Tax=Pollutimonas nitritireducens TaxID=2045209 RepID=A0A2N4UJC4_9BURK|nr:fluoride efflux transporter CrcB [Pollutimonas nitritireducens]PLC55127.1 fluoride efflux transporter CrcB [Pollutimonas nitritireducens]